MAKHTTTIISLFLIAVLTYVSGAQGQDLGLPSEQGTRSSTITVVPPPSSSLISSPLIMSSSLQLSSSRRVSSSLLPSSSLRASSSRQCYKKCHDDTTIPCEKDCCFIDCGGSVMTPCNQPCPPDICMESSAKKASSSQPRSSSLRLSSSLRKSSSQRRSSSLACVKVTKVTGKRNQNSPTYGVTGDGPCLSKIKSLPNINNWLSGEHDTYSNKQYKVGDTCPNTYDASKGFTQVKKGYWDCDKYYCYWVDPGYYSKDKNYGKNLKINNPMEAMLCTLGRSEPGLPMYLDANCNIVDSNKVNICVTSNITVTFASPISLILDNKHITPTVSNFPLDPKNPNKYVIWRASESAPLLVYDPKKTGEITSADQLFGQYAFGKTWKDGFEALASLDKNADGKLTGEELEDLSLWFDKNQNGVSEPGEVVDLREAGITALYFKKDNDNVMTGDIIVSVGYDRIKDGKLISGSSIDWFSETYDTREEALANIERRTAAIMANPANMTSSPDNKFTGVWVWTIDKNKSDAGIDETNNGGLLSFFEIDGRLNGLSIAELMLESNQIGAKSAVLSNRLNDAVIDSDGKLKFTIEQDGLVTETVAGILPDNNTMRGVSRAEVVNEDTGEKNTVHYTWVATRL